MARLSGDLAQIVWAETKWLDAGRAESSADVNNIRRMVAQLAASTEGQGFGRREPLPATNDSRYGDLMIIAEEAKNATAPQNRLIFWEAGADTKRPNQSPKPPSPWDTMSEAGIHYQGRFRGTGGQLFDVFSRAPLAGTADGAVFVNAVTGTGVEGGRPAMVQKRQAEAKPKLGFRLFIISAVLFVIAALWAYGVGVASRLAIEAFQQTAAIKGTPGPSQIACDPVPPEGLEFVLGPANWRPADGQPSQCYARFRDALEKIAKGSSGGFLERFASWSLSVPGVNGWSVSLVMPLALGFLALALLFVSAGYGITGRPMGPIIDSRYRMSLTIAQLVLWSIVILGGWLVLGLFNFGVGGLVYGALDQAAAATGANSVLRKLAEAFYLFPSIPREMWAVLGLAGVTPFVSRLISQTGLVSPPTPPPPTSDSTDQVPDYLDRNSNPSEVHLTDMVVKETEGASNLVDATRVQHAAMTGILVVGYAMLLFDAVSAIDPTRTALAAVAMKSVFTSMPPVDGTFLTLLGVSHAALLTSKVYDKKMTVPTGTSGGTG